MHRLSETRARQLDALLSQAGQNVFPFDASQITPARVRSSVSESGTLPGARNDLGEGADYFILGNGRIELVDQQAVFYPAGSAQPIRAAADANDDASSMVVQSQAGSTAPTGAPAPTTVPAPTPLFPKISAWPALLAVGESLLSLALAIYLLVIGILVFRGSPNSARQHRIYAIIKIPLALLAGFAWGYVWHQMMASMPFRSGGLGAVFVGYAIVMALLSMGYPIGLLFALQSRKVREFYATARC
jgi:hypothetical protein